MANKFNSELNLRLSRLRKSKGFTQAMIAESLGMKTSTYSQMERMGNITAQTILDIASVLKVDPMDIIDPENKGLINVDSGDSNILLVNQPNISFTNFQHEKKAIELTNREENAIIMLRNIKAEDREKIYADIKAAHDKKFKKSNLKG